MLPKDEDDVVLDEEQRSRIMDWLSSEFQMASQVRRAERWRLSFRRMTSYLASRGSGSVSSSCSPNFSSGCQ